VRTVTKTNPISASKFHLLFATMELFASKNKTPYYSSYAIVRGKEATSCHDSLTLYRDKAIQSPRPAIVANDYTADAVPSQREALRFHTPPSPQNRHSCVKPYMMAILLLVAVPSSSAASSIRPSLSLPGVVDVDDERRTTNDERRNNERRTTNDER